MERLGIQGRDVWRKRFGQIAVVATRRNIEFGLVIIERQVRAQVDRRHTALDKVGARRLVNVNATHQFRCDLSPTDRTRPVGAEHLLTIQRAGIVRQPPDRDSRAFDLKGGRSVLRYRKTRQRHARNALQHFGNGSVRQFSCFVGHHRVNDSVGQLLDFSCLFQRLAAGCDDDRLSRWLAVVLGGGIRGGRRLVRGGVLSPRSRLRDGGLHHGARQNDGQATNARPEIANLHLFPSQYSDEGQNRDTSRHSLTLHPRSRQPFRCLIPEAAHPHILYDKSIVILRALSFCNRRGAWVHARR